MSEPATKKLYRIQGSAIVEVDFDFVAELTEAEADNRKAIRLLAHDHAEDALIDEPLRLDCLTVTPIDKEKP